MIIGTHDSCAYKLNFNISFWDTFNKFEVLRKLARVPWFKNKILNATLTQDHDIRQQLNMGCRALDIRVSQKDGIFYTNHTFCCGTLDEMLVQVKAFLLSAPNETVHLLIKPDWENRNTMNFREEQLFQYLSQKLEKEINLGAVRCYYKSSNATIFTKFPFMHKFNNLDFVWLNVSSVDEFMDKFNRNATYNNSIFNYVLTPNSDSSVTELMNVNISDYADKLNPTVFEMFDKKNQPKFLLFDFVDKDFVTNVQRHYM
jgi:hypothetical protein